MTMRWIKVGCASLNQTPLDWKGNLSRILLALERARAEKISLLCFPELCLTGYGCEDSFFAAGVQRAALKLLEEVARAGRGMVLAVGLPIFHEQGLYNGACLIADGKIAGIACKQHLARDGIHYEPRWFRAWPAGRAAEITISGKRVPIGDLIFDLPALSIGFEICEDAWAVRRPGIRQASLGVDAILNPSASHFAFGKFEVRKRFVLEGSRAFGTAYLYANLIGNESGRVIFDGGSLVASQGLLIAQGPRLGYGDVYLTSAVVDLETLRLSRSRTAQEEDGGVENGLPKRIAVPIHLEQAQPDISAPRVASWENSGFLKEEEFARAVALGLFDYLRKSRSKGFVVSLSGGADSSSISCLVNIMLLVSWRELGPAGLKEKLGYIPAVLNAVSPQQMMAALLTCVYQATKNSSTQTREAARAISQAVGAEFLELEVQPFVDEYVSLVEATLGRTLEWNRDDISLQNIQARVRGPGVWLIANVKDALLLATSNRSEAAVGYTTMDGDTCGGLSPIAGIDKAFLRHWLRWIEKTGLDSIGPIPALAAVNAQEPTAELRPAGAGQTDERDLMPYEVLDAVERFAIRDKKFPAEVLALTRAAFPHIDEHALGQWVDRFFRLWCRNQWKRERYAPSFHLDDENLDPKTWCRFPILSGGFEEELRELKGKNGCRQDG